MNPVGAILLLPALVSGDPAHLPATLYDTPPAFPGTLHPVPPPSIGYVESSSYPIRVYYNLDTQLAYANTVLSAADDAWKRQVVELGYPAPWTAGEEEPVQQGLWFYVATVGTGGGAYTQPLADVPSTTRADCSCRVVIDPLNASVYVPRIVDHELNHSAQLATDCVEALSAYEMFATATTYLAMPDSGYFKGNFLNAFQAWPEYSLDFWTRSSLPGKPGMLYNYGAALFPVFLQERYGQGEPAFLADLFASFSQDGTVTVQPSGGKSDQPNSPDWFEAVAARLQEKGTDFDSAFDEFAEWRAMVGVHDDSAHFAHGTDYGPPAIAVSLTPEVLPQQGELTVHEYGTRYIEVSPGSTEAGLLVHLEIADPQTTWGGSVLLWRDGAPVERLPLVFDQSGTDIEVESLAGVSRALVVVSHHSDGTHDPDEAEYTTTASFTYALSLVDRPDAGLDAEAAPDAEEALEAAPDSDADAGDGQALLAEPPTDGGDGCSCGAAGRPVSRSVWMIGWVAAAALARRRRRANESSR